MRRLGSVLLGAALAGAVMTAPPAGASPSGDGVVINEVYVNGGSTGATYLNKFVELYNPTDHAISVNGWSVQYRSATGTAAFSGVTPLGDHHLEPGGTLLVSGNSNAANGAALPTPDVAGTTSFSGSTGTIALSKSTTALSGQPSAVLADANRRRPRRLRHLQHVRDGGQEQRHERHELAQPRRQGGRHRQQQRRLHRCCADSGGVR